jgi:hypothetical protein
MRFGQTARRLALAGAVALAAPLASPSGVSTAEAAVSVQMSLDELVLGSTYVAVATAVERRAAWEEGPGGRRIVTYTRLRVERAVAGEPAGEVWVKTLGGVVGKVGQAVSGEAQIAIGSTSLLFLVQAGADLVVNGLAQGHFPLLGRADGPPTLAASPDAGLLVPRRGPSIGAREQLVGATLDRAVDLVTRAKQARDAR